MKKPEEIQKKVDEYQVLFDEYDAKVKLILTGRYPELLDIQGTDYIFHKKDEYESVLKELKWILT